MLKRELPEAMKPKQIPIKVSTSHLKTIEGKVESEETPAEDKSKESKAA